MGCVFGRRDPCGVLLQCVCVCVCVCVYVCVCVCVCDGFNICVISSIHVSRVGLSVWNVSLNREAVL
jgi:hypothetical protein